MSAEAVFVTGAGGFIGGHLVEMLVEAGRKVRAFVRYNSRGDRGSLEHLPPKIIQDLEIVAGDLRDEDAVRRNVRGADSVFHLGALIGIPYSYLHPRDVVETNVMGTFNVLRAALDEGVPRIVHVSTSEVYGTAQSLPMNEQHPLQSQSPYAASKIGADKVAESFYLSYGLPVTTIRPFNTFGQRQSSRAVIPTIVSQAVAGGSIQLGSIHPRRDFTYVTDTARGMVLASEREESIGQTINLGNGKDISVGELALRIIAIVGSEATVVHDRARTRPDASEVDHLRADNSVARDVLGWRPEVTLDEGLARVIAWTREHPPLFRCGEYAV